MDKLLALLLAMALAACTYNIYGNQDSLVTSVSMMGTATVPLPLPGVP